jgi:hypothetical protein
MFVGPPLPIVSFSIHLSPLHRGNLTSELQLGKSLFFREDASSVTNMCNITRVNILAETLSLGKKLNTITKNIEI